MPVVLPTVLSLALLLALQLAPLLHVHEKGHAMEHVAAKHGHGLAAHTHASGHQEAFHGENGPEVGSSDENTSAIAIDLFHSETAKAPIHPLAVRVLPVPGAVTLANVRIPPERPRVHDPPFQTSLIPRAPPA